MRRQGPVVLVEDDPDDQEIITSIFQTLGYPNEVLCFSDAQLALEYLRSPALQPFIVISDINMPKFNGFELRSKIFEDEQLRKKCMPYLFLTTHVSPDTVIKAYNLSIQGIMQKPSTVQEFEYLIKAIVEYWRLNVLPPVVHD